MAPLARQARDLLTQMQLPKIYAGCGSTAENWNQIPEHIWRFPKNGVPQKWMVYNGQSFKNRWFGGTPILGTPPIWPWFLLYFMKNLRTCSRPNRSQNSRHFFQTSAGDLAHLKEKVQKSFSLHICGVIDIRRFQSAGTGLGALDGTVQLWQEHKIHIQSMEQTMGKSFPLVVCEF